jgi:hypothetical protein
MQDEASDAILANAPSSPPPPQGVGSDDAGSHGFSAHSEAPPDPSGCEDIKDRCHSQHRSEISSRQSFKQQKLTAELQASRRRWGHAELSFPLPKVHQEASTQSS